MYLGLDFKRLTVITVHSTKQVYNKNICGCKQYLCQTCLILNPHLLILYKVFVTLCPTLYSIIKQYSQSFYSTSLNKTEYAALLNQTNEEN